MKDKYEIQAVDSPFVGRIPPGMWRTVGRATTPRGAYRIYAREWGRHHPQPGAWTGHVRILRNGKPVHIEKYGFDVHEIGG